LPFLSRKNVCVLYFLVCLLLSLVYLNSVILTTAFMTGWNINIENSSVFLCKLMFYVTFITASLIPTILILASIDRLLISSQNVDTRLSSSKRLAYFLIGVSIVFWILFHLYTLIKMNVEQFDLYYLWKMFDIFALFDVNNTEKFDQWLRKIFNCFAVYLLKMLFTFQLVSFEVSTRVRVWIFIRSEDATRINRERREGHKQNKNTSLYMDMYKRRRKRRRKTI